MYHTSVGHIILLWWRSYILCLHFFGELYLDLLSPSITKMVMLCMYVWCSQRGSIGVGSDRYLHPVRQHERQHQIPHWADHTSSAAVSISVVAMLCTLCVGFCWYFSICDSAHSDDATIFVLVIGSQQSLLCQLLQLPVFLLIGVVMVMKGAHNEAHL